ncbi:hypothetical protein F5884DRAFT_341225 [Xylogone sp. PMI_703]|nr:hypothetical protein F5884DRAFT_341225 [Xylogone sp. PMI_703]
MACDPFTAASTATRLLREVENVRQASFDVDSSITAIRSYQKNLRTLIELRKECRELLEDRPALDKKVEEAINQAWASLESAKPILERNRDVPNPLTNLGHGVRWTFFDQNKYRRLLEEIQRNDNQLSDHIQELRLLRELAPVQLGAEADANRRLREQANTKAKMEAAGRNRLNMAMGFTPQVPAQELVLDRSSFSMANGSATSQSDDEMTLASKENGSVSSDGYGY